MMRTTGWWESPMFERFTDGARRVVVRAQHEARRLNHNYIGTEHLLLGLLGDGRSSGNEDLAAAALESFGISLEMVRYDVEEIIGKGKTTPGDHIPFTPRAKKVLELSLREALQLGHNYIGTEHILLGLVREGEGVAVQVLVKRGAGLNAVRERVVELVPEQPAGEAPAGERVPGAATMRVHRAVVAPPLLGRIVPHPPELVRVVPIGRQVEIEEGLRLVLLSLEIWSGWLDLRLATVCSAPGRSAGQLLASYTDWQLSDDLDTDYRQVGASNSGDDQMQLGQVSFQPSPPTEAKTLTLTAAGEGEAQQLRVEVEMS